MTEQQILQERIQRADEQARKFAHEARQDAIKRGWNPQAAWQQVYDQVMLGYGFTSYPSRLPPRPYFIIMRSC